MQYGNYQSQARYDLTAPGFQTAFAFLTREDLDSLAPGSIALENGVKANILNYATAYHSENVFETHEAYFDVQYLVSGEERILVAQRETLTVRVPYDPDKDVVFYEDPEECSSLVMKAGDYAVFSPEDGHKVTDCLKDPVDVVKIVLKVPVAGAVR